ncbi:MAG: galactose mutarotase [Clostridia bacterium]|nr:galactose mutarotase [Clostridia bacterium]
MGIAKRLFGKTPEGVEADIFTLNNTKGLIVEITNYGGIIVSLITPDRSGKKEDITLGYDSLEGYLKDSSYFGAIIGRNANRVENAEFSLNGIQYYLAKNDGNNHLHGGFKGFDKVVWNADIVRYEESESLRLAYKSKDMEENYPGNLNVEVIYSLTEDSALKIDYYAVADKDTVVNLTNHAYFNLAGHSAGDVSKHLLMIKADRFTPVNREGIPTGEIREVKNTPMDFTALTPIGPGLSSKCEQIVNGKGYDHNWVLNVSSGHPEKASELYEPESGRVLEIYTTKPGIQFYSGNFLDGSIVGKGGTVYSRRSGLCLETQYFPNAMKHKHFPSPILKAGEEYRHTTIYKFLTR